jgi:WD40 repeat protein
MSFLDRWFSTLCWLAIAVVGSPCIAVQGLEGDAPKNAKRASRFDYYGDTLPSPALARMGTKRLRSDGSLTVMAFSVDGSMVAAGDSHYSVRVWDVRSAKQVSSYSDHDAAIWSLVFSNDGKEITSADMWGNVRRRFIRGGKRILSWADKDAFAPILSHDGAMMVSVSRDSPALNLHSVTTGELVKTIQIHGGDAKSVVVSADAKTVAGGDDEEQVIRLVDVATGKQIQALKATGYRNMNFGVTSYSFSPRENVLAYVYGAEGESALVHVWDVARGKEVRRWKSDLIGTIAFSGDGRIVASSHAGRKIRLTDVATGREIRLLEGDGLAAVSRDAKILATGATYNAVRLLETSTGKDLHPLEGHERGVLSVTISPNGKRVASGSNDDTIRQWDMDTGKELQKYNYRGEDLHQVHALAFSPDGKILAAGGHGDNALILDAANATVIHRIKPGEYVYTIAFSPDGRQLALGLIDSVRFFSVETWKELRSLPGGRPAFSIDAGTVATTDGDDSIGVWDVGKGKKIRKFSGRYGRVTSIAFSPDGKMIASAGRDNAVRLWDASTGKEIRVHKKGNRPLGCVAFSPDGKILAAAARAKTNFGSRDDRAIYLWDAATGKELAELSGHEGAATCIALTPDGRLVSGSEDTTLLVWDVQEAIKRSSR